MAGTTPKFALPYPSPPDPADVPSDIQALAARLDAVLADLAYVEATTGFTVTATSEATAQTLLTAPAITLDGSSPVIVECFIPTVSTPTAAGSYVVLTLWQGSTPLGNMVIRADAAIAAGQTMALPVKIERKLTPAAGSQVFTVRAHGSVSGGFVGGGAGGAGASLPAFLRVRRAG